jgi:hypothetical protein
MLHIVSPKYGHPLTVIDAEVVPSDQVVSCAVTPKGVGPGLPDTRVNVTGKVPWKVVTLAVKEVGLGIAPGAMAVRSVSESGVIGVVHVLVGCCAFGGSTALASAKRQRARRCSKAGSARKSGGPRRQLARYGRNRPVLPSLL